MKKIYLLLGDIDYEGYKVLMAFYDNQKASDVLAMMKKHKDEGEAASHSADLCAKWEEACPIKDGYGFDRYRIIAVDVE